MAVDFSGILKKPLTDIKPPVMLPIGTYAAMILGFTFGESKEKKTPFAEFNLAITAAFQDVDADQLEKAGGVEGKKVKLKAYLTEDSAFRLKEMLEDHAAVSGSTLEELLQNCPNSQIGLIIKHRADDKDADKVYLDVAKTFKL